MFREGQELPAYHELLERDDAPKGSSWGLFGEDDQLGTINFLTPERTRAAAACVKRGVTFNLDCPLNAFDPPTSWQRKPHKHVIFGNNPYHRDDYLQDFYLQAGSQVDALRHMCHPIHGFYNAAPSESIVVGDDRNGISHLAEYGIAGRGVLLDLERHLRLSGNPLDHRSSEAITIETLVETAEQQGVDFQPGDILMLRTGWLDYYFNVMSDKERQTFPDNIHAAGLLQSRETLAWLWDQRIAVCAADNIGVEAIPPAPSSPFAEELEGVVELGGIYPRLMHPHLIAMLGITLGELWDLDQLAADCEDDGVWECFVTVKPLNLIGGVGSPANAIAIK
jgi:kynurenine formamidase